MDAAEPEIVDWPSLLLAVLLDSLIVWTPAVLVFALGGPAAVALGLLTAAVAAYWAFLARGATPGTGLCGFSLRTRSGDKPGPKYGLVLALMALFSVPAAVAIAVINVPGADAGGPPGDPAAYPIRGERIARRRLLEAADAYWERHSG
ncbi:hypothetical protein BIU82_15995 [Arthrobacter sp. SW1]|uniref:hypothetical protein n=1 Tax=Arthrobacter sp. SW1 TaxID=1920889 RepID=UPI000877E0DC|nr:hypothetical protein [Arthrobacter sp. SW1]OFI39139.1 hypothetical protein BIU82_15995 [Arthrobacter sp. SW1]